MTAYVLCGIPASGKTTLAKQLAQQHDATIHSIDDVPHAWDSHDIDGKFRRQWMENIKKDLQNGNSVVCDSTALNSASRKWILKELSAFDCEKILCIKVVPVEMCIQRNANRSRKVPEENILDMAKVLEAPTKDEGWDKILVYRD